MKRHWSASVAITAATTLLLASTAVHAEDLGHDQGLAADIPAPQAHFQSQRAIQEGGLHFVFVATTDTEALPLLFHYRLVLEAAGWTVPGVGGGGNPFGGSGGAQLTAEHPDGRFLRIEAGHPGVQHLDHAPSVATFVDACVWPHTPEDVGCHPQRRIDDEGDVIEGALVGAAGELTVGVPRPAVSEYRSEDVIAEGGRHFHYLSAAPHFSLFSDYLRLLHESGWTVDDSTTHGDWVSGGGTASASDGSRYLRFSVGGSGLLAYFDVCLWPQPPTYDGCARSGPD